MRVHPSESLIFVFSDSMEILLERDIAGTLVGLAEQTMVSFQQLNKKYSEDYELLTLSKYGTIKTRIISGSLQGKSI